MRKNPYRHLKPKIKGPSIVGKMKSVRIDARTQIFVSVNVSDQEAKERYLRRINRKGLGGYTPEDEPPPEIQKASIEAIGSLEDLQSIAEETNLGETE